MAQLFTNNAKSTLASGINNSATSISLAAGTGSLFPNPTGGDYFYATIYQVSGSGEANHEIVKVTARSTDTLTVTRAQEGTTAKSFNTNDPIELRLTTGFLNDVTLTAPGLSGVATFSAGTAAAPALTTSGDTNTGVYFPAADNVAITTGGTQRLSVDSLGNVGHKSGTPQWAPSGNDGVVVSGATTGTTNYISTYLDNSTLQIGAGTTQKTGVVIYGQTTGTGSVVAIRTGNAERLKVQADGDVVFSNGITENVYTITDGAAFEIDPTNGTVQTITLGADRTPKGTNFAAGQSVTLMVDDGSARTLTWTDSTFGTGGVTWVGGTAPTLATSGYTVIELWKVATKVYGALVGTVA